MLPGAIAGQLRARGHDATAVTERSDLRSLVDADLLALATDEERVLVTADRGDYLELDRLWRAGERSHAGIVLLSSRFPVSRPGPLVRALDAFLADEPPYPGFVHWLTNENL